MVKNLNMFTGKVDILADRTDSKQEIELERYKLGHQAGRVIKIKQTKIAPAKNNGQVTLF